MKRLKDLFSITPFKLSLFIILVFISASIIYDVNPGSLTLLSTLDQKSLDIKFKTRGTIPPKNKIVIVTADEKSFQTYGQWPWDRANVFAPLIEKVCGYNPKALGFDMVWSEHEKTIPDRVKNALRASLEKSGTSLDSIIEENNSNSALRKAVSFCKGKAVLGYALSTDENNGLGQEDFIKRLTIMAESGGNILSTITKGNVKFPEYPGDPEANVDFDYSARTGLLNIPEITPPNTPQGFFNNDGDNDGNYRHAFLFYRTPGGFASSLTLRMAQKYLSSTDTPPSLTVQPYDPDHGKAQELKLEMSLTNGAKRSLPIDLKGKLIINYRGPNLTYPNISMSDLLSSSDTVEYEIFDPKEGRKKLKQHKSDIFKDALVLVGITANALYDIRPRPFDAQAAGVENHANILDNIISDDFIIRPTTELLLILNGVLLVLSIIYGFAIIRSEAKIGAAIAAVSITGLLILDQKYLFSRNILFAGPLQAIQFLFQYIAITVLKYMKEEKEKRHIRSAFDKYVSPAVINEMLSDPTKLQLGGEKKELSIMFSDIRGFTEMSEKLDVKSLSQMLNEYLGAMTDILQKNSGTLDKYIGDAVMGFWGAPLAIADQRNLAVKTTVEMIAKVFELNKTFKPKYGIELDIGLGINTGEVSVGNFGSSKVFEYTVIGDNVNLASRLESLNKYYGTRIIISEFTMNGLHPEASKWTSREIDTVRVKGKKKPVKIYEILPNIDEYSSLKSVLKPFSNALGEYYNRNWDVAIAGFKAVLAKHEKDKVSLEMIERCEYYKANPPHADWDGSFEMKTK